MALEAAKLELHTCRQEASRLGTAQSTSDASHATCEQRLLKQVRSTPPAQAASAGYNHSRTLKQFTEGTFQVDNSTVVISAATR